MPRLLVIRHGQSTWNAEGRWQGWADPPLTDLGERQAAEAAARLDGTSLDGVVSSDLRRAVRTAEIVSGALGLGEVEIDPGLRERDVGDWSGLTRSEISRRWPQELSAWLGGRLPAIPGGEREDAFADRACRTVERLAARGRDLLLVSHGGLLRALERSLGAGMAAVGNLGGRWFELGGDGTLLAGDRVILADRADRTTSPSA